VFDRTVDRELVSGRVRRIAVDQEDVRELRALLIARRLVVGSAARAGGFGARCGRLGRCRDAVGNREIGLPRDVVADGDRGTVCLPDLSAIAAALEVDATRGTVRAGHERVRVGAVGEVRVADGYGTAVPDPDGRPLVSP